MNNRNGLLLMMEELPILDFTEGYYTRSGVRIRSMSSNLSTRNRNVTAIVISMV